MAILSIQSHVVYGYAGNTSAVFPMQRLGHEVWAINTVEFSNHTGYGKWKGAALDSKLVCDLVTGLEELGALENCEAVLSGYLGGADSGNAVIEAIEKTRKYSPKAIYCCDPVMGDVGRGFYVKPGIPEIFKTKLVPIADIVCPNLFELEALTEINVFSVEDAVKAINILHEMGPSIVLVTSFKEKADESESDKKISMLVSDGKNIYRTTTAELPLGNGAAGTGDLTTAVFLSRYLETKNIEKTLELCTASVFGILESSLKKYLDKKGDRPIELKTVDFQEELCAPSNYYYAQKIK